MAETKEKKPNKLLQALSIIPGNVLGRLNLATKMGVQYGGDRDLYQALGYPLKIGWNECMAQYRRQDIAKAVIDKPVNKTWAGPLSITESKNDKETPLEKAWTTLDDELKLKHKFARLDKLTGLGKYGILLLGFSDVIVPSDFERPVMKGQGLKLMYVRPLGAETAPIVAYESDPTNPRYGSPLLYDISLVDPAGNKSSQVKVHYTRVIHVIDGALESDIDGIPRLEPIYNRLQDLEKIVGGSAEMYWRGARPGFDAKVDEGFSLSADAEEALEDQFDEYENNLRRFLINKGVTIKALDAQVYSPKDAADIAIQMISAETGIPKRILTGSERGELSSAQDASEWSAYIQSRREEFAEPQILRPFIDLLIELKILPPVDNEEAGYSISWEDLFAISEKEKVEIGKTRSMSLKEYSANPLASNIVPPDAFFEFCLGFSAEQIELIKEMQDAYMIEEEARIEEDRLLAEETQG